MRMGGSIDFGHYMCRLWRTNKADDMDLESVKSDVVFEFDCPKGESLESWLNTNGQMTEAVAQRLCRDLLNILIAHGQQHTMLRFWGLLLPNTVFVSPDGALVSVLPLGSVLSLRGARAVAKDITCWGIAPELLRVNSTNYSKHQDPWKATDSYGVAALVLEALARIKPKNLMDKNIVDTLPHFAIDFLHKALFDDPSWRLTGREAMSHPWMQRGRRKQVV